MGRRRKKSEIPDFEINALARAFLPRIIEFYRTEEGQREFAQWQAKEQLNKKEKDKKSF